MLDVSDVNSLKNDIAYYAEKVTDMDDTGDSMKQLIDGIESQNPITKPEKLFCIRQSYAAVKDVLKTLAIDNQAAQAATDLMTLATNGDCNLYTIPSQVCILSNSG